MSIEVHYRWKRKKNVTVVMDYEVEGYVEYLLSHGATHIETKMHLKTN